MIRALGMLKKAAALTNGELGTLSQDTSISSCTRPTRSSTGKLDAHFPLFVWQTGSGTQTNMNVNEVISNRAIEMAGGVVGWKKPIHPNDHVNRGQSSNDTFPTAMHIAAAEEVVHQLLPARRTAQRHAARESHGVRATSSRSAARTFRTRRRSRSGRRFPGWVAQLDLATAAIEAAMPPVYELALGGTAVGTGLNTHPEYAVRSAKHIAMLTGLPFKTAPNKFAALAGHEPLVALHGAIKTLASRS